MAILVVGSVAYDSVRTTLGGPHVSLGGAATYFSIAASYFAPVSMVAVVGDDFRPEDQRLLDDHQVETSGLTRVKGSTFRWIAEYGEDLSEAHTLDTHLNVFADFQPNLSPTEKNLPYLFLANIDPDLQHQVVQQMEKRPKLVAGDTMNFWIEGKPDALARVISSMDALLINESEVRQLAGESNLIKAARHILKQGPSLVIVKRGEYGVIGFTNTDIFAAPAYPLESVVDPTGAGDSFAGGYMGYLAASGDLTMEGRRCAMIAGAVMASFTVECFGLDRLSSLSTRDIRSRYREMLKLTYFGRPDDAELPMRNLDTAGANKRRGH